jgi:proteic killer suppression protein
LRGVECRDDGSMPMREVIVWLKDAPYEIDPEILALGKNLEDHESLTTQMLEALAGDRQGQYSIRINGQWRICFTWGEGAAENVEIVDYH